ncbi:MAG: hypothetical protein R3192_14165 [Woeseiaceae bacterium]|nr:hypothetical protein [Woeseiaceae bacterium]
MERIAKLLFALTIVTIFSLVLTFSFVHFSGNGGEYWGFDGIEEPWKAASRSFESGDYRLLAFDLENSHGVRTKEFPDLIQCENLPKGMGTTVRMNQVQSQHGHDSIHLASTFAHKYNLAMQGMILSEISYFCVVSDE